MKELDFDKFFGKSNKDIIDNKLPVEEKTQEIAENVIKREGVDGFFKSMHTKKHEPSIVLDYDKEEVMEIINEKI